MKLKVLICAYACLGAPDKRFSSADGGEGGLGWNAVHQLDRFYQTFVLTHIENRQLIEKKLSKERLLSTEFYYIGLPGWLDCLQKFNGGVQFYAYIWQIKAYFIAKKLHKERHFNVFHHITFANDWMASYIGAFLPVPYIRGPGGGAHFVPKGFVKEYSFRKRLIEKLRSIGQWVFKHDPFFIIGQNKAKAILVCNKEAFNALPQKWQKKAYYFPVNGISINDFKITKKAIANEFSVITAGRLLKIKGFDLAIKAFKIFNDKISNSKLIIVGAGPESENLKKLSGELKIEDKIVFPGWLPQKTLFQKITDSNIFLFPSLRDGGGNVIVEAMAAGKPVVCFDIAGPGFHIDANCGIKIKPENPRQAIGDMAKALEKLYFDKNLRLKLGAGARKKAESDYDWNKLGDKLNEIYKRIL